MNFNVLDYTEQKIEYCRLRIEEEKRKLEFWSNAKRTKTYSWMDIQDKLSEIGFRIAFYEDCIKGIELAEELTDSLRVDPKVD